MKAAHPNPAGRAMRACDAWPGCDCRDMKRFDRSRCEDRYKRAVREIIDETVWKEDDNAA